MTTASYLPPCSRKLAPRQSRMVVLPARYRYQATLAPLSLVQMVAVPVIIPVSFRHRSSL